MNKHGQTLILFVILIPIFLIIFALVVDIGIVTNKKMQINNVTNEAVEKFQSMDDTTIKDLFVKNDIPIDNLTINRGDNSIEIKNEMEVESIFGSIIGIKKYDIKIDVHGRLQDGKVIIDKR